MTVTDAPTTTTTQRTRRKPPPRVLVLRCDVCCKRLGRNGYLKVDTIAVSSRRTGEVPIYWAVLHPECDGDAKNTDYRLRGELFSTTGDLLEATAFLMRNEPWIIDTNWHGLIGRVLADTREYADWILSTQREQQNERRRELKAKRREEQSGVLAEVRTCEEVEDD